MAVDQWVVSESVLLVAPAAASATAAGSH